MWPTSFFPKFFHQKSFSLLIKKFQVHSILKSSSRICTIYVMNGRLKLSMECSFHIGVWMNWLLHNGCSNANPSADDREAVPYKSSKFLNCPLKYCCELRSGDIGKEDYQSWFNLDLFPKVLLTPESNRVLARSWALWTSWTWLKNGKSSCLFYRNDK